MKRVLLGLVLTLSGPVMAIGKTPPPASSPELSESLRKTALESLDAPEFVRRDAAQKLLEQGGLQTAEMLPGYVQAASLEGRIRAVQIIEQIALRMLRSQADNKYEQLIPIMDEMRLVGEAVIGSRLEEFRSIHSRLIESANIRALIRLNAIVDFETSMETIPGLSQRFNTEFMVRIYLGDDFAGTEDDLRHISDLLLLGEQQFGNSRGVYHIGDCPIPLKTLQELVAGMPGVQVVHRGPARIGIMSSNSSLNNGNENWHIQSVQNGSSAKYAGLQINDVIVRLDGRNVGGFDSFVTALEAYEPNQTAELHVQRNFVEPEKITLTLGEDLKTGLEVDEDFQRFVLIRSVEADSPADKAGLSNMYRIDRVENQPMFNLADYELAMDRLRQNNVQNITLHVRRLEEVPVLLRGWVGPYR
ncbi:PDZ domain-containing protein [Rubinisphaera margarita]|uniref:PDZ domain-containing protein n=1 Tax=Rubinisphaera margarita TaxID=2909586 RepID=UPI001EE8DBF3|nr:PDZ domain-containing protein [Rubinisphaera margarita]MCG6157980.1 PDZ domain-containing protein [Rubinisphaera margarita]